jgi:peptidoglycan/LPS O-acetylase OafA/YrhL
MNYLGKISYGLYIIHNFAVSMWLSLIVLLGNPVWLMKLYAVPAFRILGFAGLTIGLASLSWHIFEKPINNLKRKFPYPSDKPQAPLNLPQTDIPNPSS